MKIVFFGDSITEGCFEILNINGTPEILRDPPSGYAARVAKALPARFPDIPFVFVNRGKSGDATDAALGRLASDVLAEHPGLVICCFGLNDAGYRDPALFAARLSEIFVRLQAGGAKVVYMTPNMMNRYVSPEVHDGVLATARDCAACQNDGTFDRYMEAAIAAAHAHGVPVADAYARWKELDRYGVDTTALLCNRINHPTRKMHALFADVLLEVLGAEGVIVSDSQ